ncbi:MAG: FABP family protein [Burkholderiales bacterium]|nr:FABP family protein [Burkholderiales bacterium]
MADWPSDIYTEPTKVDVDTLACLGPLAPLAGLWEGQRGLDVKPKAEGPKKQAYVERIELQPIDPQTNGPQLLYGLRYHTHVTKPGQVKTYHDQVGYWLWEPATGTVMHTLTIPRGQTAMAAGTAAPDAKSFDLVATQGLETWGICSAPFLQHAFRTVEFRIKVTVNADGTWGYEEDTVLVIQGQAEPFHHTDRNLLVKVGEATPNPLAAAARAARTAAAAAAPEPASTASAP